MKYGVIGTSWITEAFISGADAATGMELTAVMSRQEASGQAFLEKLGRTAQVVTSLEDLIKSGVDGVYVASPNLCHYEQTRTLLEHGIHVICEKPCTITPGQVKKLAALAKSRGLVYMEAIMGMYLPERKILKEAMRKLGKIHSAHIDFSQLSSKYPAYLAGKNPNIFNPAIGAGGLMDLGIYCVYPILDWFGMPEKLSASARFLESGADHSGAVIFEYPDQIVSMTYSKIGQGHGGSEIIGDEGSLTIGSISQYNQVSLNPPKGEGTLLVGETTKTYCMSHEAAAFRDAVSGVRQIPQETLDKMIQVAEILEQIRDLAGIRFAEEIYAED